MYGFRYKYTVQWTMQGLTEVFFNIVGFCNITEAKSREVCIVYWKGGLFSKTKRHLQNDAVWFLNCQSGPSLVALSCLGGQQKFTKFDRVCYMVYPLCHIGKFNPPMPQ